MNTVAQILAVALVGLATVANAAKAPDYTNIVAELIAPARLATLGERGANPRVQKYVYWLATAQTTGINPKVLAVAAIEAAGYTNKLACKLTVDAMLLNLDRAGKLGCLDAAGLDEMRHGKSPTIRKGRYAGDQLSVDHAIPRSVVPELDNVIANLELLPQRVNSSKKDKMGARQRALAKELQRAGLLST